MSRVLVAILISGIGVRAAPAADWPQYRRDAARSGYTAETLPRQPSQLWIHEAVQAPEPASPRSPRLGFDRASRLVIQDGLLCFGSSADGRVQALDAASGEACWSFFTDGPVRFAPVFFRDTVIFGSDDGFLYCLARSDGELRWKRRGAPDAPETIPMVLGNGRMISLWPVRGGPVLQGDVLYFAAGIWPSEGIYIHAIDPVSGKTTWSNTDSGGLHIGQPHGGAYADSGVGAQGYLAATETQVFVPNGRAVPAAFRAEDGKFEYFHLQKYGHNGGADICLSGPAFLNQGAAYRADGGEQIGKPGGSIVAVTPEEVVRLTGAEIELCSWKDQERTDRKGAKFTSRELEKIASIKLSPAPDAKRSTPSLIVAGRTALVGHAGQVDAYALDGGERLWSREVPGQAHELAVAAGRLFVSTSEGRIVCFGRRESRSIPPARPGDSGGVGASDASAAEAQKYGRIADEILKRTGARRGYCVDLDCGDGSLAIELARRSELSIYAVSSDPASITRARAKIVAAGLYGTRVTVHERDPASTGYPPLFANLVVSARSLIAGPKVVSRSEARRLLRPFGGKICLGPLDALQIEERGPLEGAGEWTHQYADPGNTSCSDDEILNGELGMFWFRDVGQEVPQRHGRAPAPLFCEGRLYSEGLDSLIAVDAYNGTLLWEFTLKGILKAYDGDHLMGTSGSGSNYCVSPDTVYVRNENHCVLVDAVTGRERGRFLSPPAREGKDGIWGYLAIRDGLVYGSVVDPGHVVTYRYQPGGDLGKQYTESSELFALDGKTGEPRWRRPARHSIRHNTISIGGGLVYFIDRPVALFDRDQKASAGEHPTGEMVALDARSGKTVWSTDEDVYGTVLVFSDEHDALVMGYQSTHFQLASEIGGRMRVYKASTGSVLWEADEIKHTTRPMVVGRTIYAEGLARDLLTGETRPFNFKRSYGCGQFAGSKNLIVYRSATLGYFDLSKNDRNRDYGGMRPGCWINALPVGGLVLVPDASAGCKCSYLNQSWIALRPTGG